MMPNSTHFPRFIIDLSDESDIEGPEIKSGPSMSLSQVSAITLYWQNKHLASARWKWVHTLMNEYQILTTDMNGEQDMDLSE